MRFFLSVTCLVVWSSAVWAGTPAAAPLRLELVPLWKGQPLRLDSSLPSRNEVHVTRLDFLLSELALRRADGTWMESDAWAAFISVGQERLRAEATGVPKEPFTAIRFQIGVPPTVDASPPDTYQPDHPLNPAVNGLHWGWQGGYVFLALEGRWRERGETKALRGFSYHLATQAHLTQIEIPVNFQGGGPVTIRIGLDVEELLHGIDLEAGETSTHSRAGDPLAARLRTKLQTSLNAIETSQDLYQPHAAKPAPNEQLPPGTQPFQLSISQRLPQLKLPTDNPLTRQGIALGEKLFHEPRLSRTNRQSCASCHERTAAFADTKRYSIGAEGKAGSRNAMPLFNLAWATSFFWDGRATSLRQQVLLPVQDKHEMNETLPRVVTKLSGTEYEQDFASAFGSSGVTTERLAKALEQYLLTLISQESRFDLAARKVAELTEQEKHGLQLFVTENDPARGLRGADCFHCHGGTLFTDNAFHNNGLDIEGSDLGRMLVTGKAADRGKFKTPSLRNIALTAPYMHDGRFETLEQVVDHYNQGVRRSETLDPNLAKHPETGLGLSITEKEALVAFLKTLTDERFTGTKGAPATSTTAANHPRPQP